MYEANLLSKNEISFKEASNADIELSFSEVQHLWQLNSNQRSKYFMSQFSLNYSSVSETTLYYKLSGVYKLL